MHTHTRLLIPLLTGWEASKACCLLKDLQEHLFPTTPTDVFVFSEENKPVRHTSDCPINGSHGSNIFFMPVRELYVTPEAAGPPDTWTASAFQVQYRMMGHWRLTFQYSFAHQLGYKFLWQLDHDSSLLGAVPFNLVDYATEKRLLVGAYEVSYDTREMLWGLAELTRYHIVAEHVEPETLYDHCEPASLEGLYTVQHLNHTQAHVGGWDRSVLYGNCVLVNVSFWMEPHVQKFVRFVVQTGAHFRFRWNEQGVVAMVWRMFVPEERFIELKDIEYKHGRQCDGESS